jgi:type IV secretory pathway protease TraF
MGTSGACTLGYTCAAERRHTKRPPRGRDSASRGTVRFAAEAIGPDVVTMLAPRSRGGCVVSTIGRAFVVSSALIFSATVMGLGAGYRINITPSLPLGLYRMAPVHAPLRHGDLVSFTLPVSLRVHRWLGRFTKPIGGLAGDRVCVQAGTLLINGLGYGPVLPDAPVHALQEGECQTVGEGYVFTASAYPRSYDSRYYRAIPITEVQRSTPVFTWTEVP